MKTLRDEIALKTLEALLLGHRRVPDVDGHHGNTAEAHAHYSYRMADVMLAARKRAATPTAYCEGH